MRVRMKIHITGYRNGEPWPLKGGVVDLPDGEARELIVNGYAEEAPDEATTEDPGGQPAAAAGPDGPATEEAADAAGEPEGSEAEASEETADLTELRAEYERVIGRKPHGNMGEAKLRQALADAED